MMDIKKRLEENYLFGCIRHSKAYNIYLMPIAYWILNYRLYDPEYDPKKWKFKFRDNVLNVLDKDVNRFLVSVKDDLITLERLQDLIFSKRKPTLYFFIDFDKKIFVSKFLDIEVEQYLPDTQWEGKFGDPKEFIPINIRSYFG